jgi:hypothetical protein
MVWPPLRMSTFWLPKPAGDSKRKAVICSSAISHIRHGFPLCGARDFSKVHQTLFLRSRLPWPRLAQQAPAHTSIARMATVQLTSENLGRDTERGERRCSVVAAHPSGGKRHATIDDFDLTGVAVGMGGHKPRGPIRADRDTGPFLIMIGIQD